MKVKIFVASAFLILVLNSCKQVEIKKHIPLINPQATEKTVKLYHFIQDIQGKHILSEEHNFVGKGSYYSDNWKKLQAKKAIIWGLTSASVWKVRMHCVTSIVFIILIFIPLPSPQDPLHHRMLY